MATASEQLPDDIDALKALVGELSERLDKLCHERDTLRDMLVLLQKQQYGRISDVVPPEQTPLPFDDEPAPVDDGAEAETETITYTRHRPGKKPGRQGLPEHLPREQVIYDLADDDRCCDDCRGELHVIRTETRELLRERPRLLWVEEQHQRIYGCRACENAPKAQPLPLLPIRGSYASPELLAGIATERIENAVPFYRQERHYRREQLPIDRDQLARWFIRVGQLLLPLWELAWEVLRQSGYLRIDETRTQVLEEPGRHPWQDSWIWVYLTGPPDPPLAVFDYQTTRGSRAPVERLEGFEGYVQCDEHGAYTVLCRHPARPRVGCWDHARRKFVDVVTTDRKDTKTRQLLDKINSLYQLEDRIRDCSHHERWQQRQQHAVPQLDAIKSELEELKPCTGPKTTLGKAVRYALRQWPALIRYCDDGRLELSNAAVERTIKEYAIGRKNSLFNQSIAGARATAVLYTLVVSARANNLDPRAYLCHLLAVMPNLDPNDTEALRALLPDRIEPELLRTSQ